MNPKMLACLAVAGLLFSCHGGPNQQLPAYSPIPLARQMPRYPDILRRADITSTVELSVLVDESGNVIDVRLAKSVALVDSVCIVAAKQWKFKPGQLADQTGKYAPAKFWFPIMFDWL